MNEVRVAHKGSIGRSDPCVVCKTTLYFKVDEEEVVIFSFCPNHLCPQWLKVIEARKETICS